MLMCIVAIFALANFAHADELFSNLVGKVQVGDVAEGTVQVPYLTWGGDVATFVANGGLKTTKDSIYGKMGLNLQLVSGDNFPQQVKDYMEGKSPYLRGTMRMMGQASEVLSQSPKTKPVVIFQLTWSAGDHLVGVESIKELKDLKGKRIALQKGGPHLGLLEDALKTAGLNWKDITPVWCNDLTGTPDSPASKLSAGEADAACLISPDMFGLTGGLENKGTGAEGTLKGAHVIVSTAQMSRSIADVYAVRSDYFKAHRDEVEKFFAGYIAASELLVTGQKKYDNGKGSSTEYLAALKMAQDIFGKEVLPTIEVDAHGLLLDCAFVRLPGNISFFTDAGNLNNFEKKMGSALDLAVNLNLVTNRFGFDKPNWDYQKVAGVAGVTYQKPEMTKGRIKGEIENFTENLDDNVIASFVINFDPNQTDFSSDVYGADFKRVIESASTFGNAVFAVRGHSDPTATLRSFIKAGMQKGVIVRKGTRGDYAYYLRGKKLDFDQSDALVKEIKEGNFTSTAENPNQVMQAALNLSLARANNVKSAIIDFAARSGFNLDESQIKPQGIGIREPVVSKPTSMAEAKKNMRVEFLLIKVPAEALQEADFDF